MPSVPAPRLWKLKDERCFSVNKFTPVALAELNNLLRDTVPDPRLQLRDLIKDLPEAVAVAIWNEQAPTLPEWPPTVENGMGRSVLSSREGMGIMIYHAVRKQHPDITREGAMSIAEQIDMDEYQDLMSLVFGAPDPKGLPGHSTSPAPENPSESPAPAE